MKYMNHCFKKKNYLIILKIFFFGALLTFCAGDIILKNNLFYNTLVKFTKSSQINKR